MLKNNTTGKSDVEFIADMIKTTTDADTRNNMIDSIVQLVELQSEHLDILNEVLKGILKVHPIVDQDKIEKASTMMCDSCFLKVEELINRD